MKITFFFWLCSASILFSCFSSQKNKNDPMRFKDFDFATMEGKNPLKQGDDPYPCLEVLKSGNIVRILIYWDPMKFGKTEEDPLEEIYTKNGDYYLLVEKYREPKGTASENIEYFYYTYIFKNYILKMQSRIDNGRKETANDLRFGEVRKFYDNKRDLYYLKNIKKAKNKPDPYSLANDADNYKLSEVQEYTVKEKSFEIKTKNVKDNKVSTSEYLFDNSDKMGLSTERKDGFSYFFDFYLHK